MNSSTLIVTGMPRSGTSLLCGILHHLGVDFGPSLVAGDNYAPTGYFENPEVIRFNQAVVAELGGNNITPGHIPPKTHDEYGDWLGRAREQADGFAALKMPRVALVSPLWEEACPDATWIVCARHPLEVARSWEHAYDLPDDYTMQLWAFYYSRLMTLPAVWVLYDEWFRDGEAQLARVCDHLGLEPDADALEVRDNVHRHHRSHGQHPLYELLCALAGREIPQPA